MIRKLGVALYCLLQLWLPGAHAQAPVTNFTATPTAGCGPLSVQFTDNSTNSPVFWSWDFGNGQTSSQQNPDVQYATAGTYTVTLITRNSSGSDAMRKTGYITVYPYPQASFSSNYTIACAPANVQFIDNSSPGQGSITSYAWSFGDGSTSNQQAPAHAYTLPGYYTVSLTVQNSGGCSNMAAVARYLRVVDGIQPNFVFNQSSTACTAPFTGTLLNQTAGPGTLSYNWTIANGATPANSSATNPIVTFPSDGTYNITLQVSSNYGCSATFTDPLTLADNSAVINGPTTVCVNTPATFTNGSTPAPTSFAWTFGDGTTSNAPSPSKTFTTTGTTSVTLVNKYAGCTTTKTDPITVINPPTPTFTATNTSGCKAPLTVSFKGESTPAPTTWTWNFGDGQTGSGQTPTHTYTTAGTFDVTLTVSTTGSCPGSITMKSLVKIQPPTVNISGTLGACTKGTGSLSVISPLANVNAPDGVATYAWSAPGSNEGSSTAATPSFTYNSANNYTISVTVTTNGGCTATASKGVQIGTAVSPAFTASQTSVCGNKTAIVFTPTIQNPSYTYYWDFGDDQDSTVAAPPSPPTYPISHFYQQPGTFPVTLEVTSNGCPNTAPPQTILVKPPIANFGYTVTGCAPGSYTVKFVDSSLTKGDAVTYNWTFGDGNTQTINTPNPNTPTNTYTTGPNTYPVTLTITDPTSGCSNTVTKNVVLVGVNPSFTIDNTTPCENNTFTLTSTSTTIPNTPGLIANYAWTVGPNNGLGNPYTTAIGTPGNYNATLVVTDINGCSYTSPSSPVAITGPIAGFTGPTIGGGCSKQLTTFNDASTGYPGNPGPPTAPPSPIIAWAYTFGDGQSQTFSGPPFTHQYTDSGKFNVLLIVGDAAGCNSAFLGTVQIDSPAANFSIPDSFYCPGKPLTFTDLSTGYTLTDAWAFNDGTSGTANPHIFPTTGAYTATLTVSDRYNCTSTITKTVNIKTPIAAFNDYDTTAICTPLETIFAAHNQFSDSLYWDFGDGSTSTLDSTYHFYNSVNTFTATLYAQGPGGCLSSTSKKVYVEDPYATTTLNYSPLKHCDSVDAQFNLIPSPYTTFQLSFGDNTYDSSGNLTPMHLYHLPGAYHPVIQLTDKTGCIVPIGSTLGAITVLGATPFFSVNKHAFCDSSIVNFTDYTISNDGLTSETYNFGDGTPSESTTTGLGFFNAFHDYNTIGTWAPALTVTTPDNCTETYTDTIRVYQTPHPLISTSSLLCTGLIQFNGNLTAPQVDTIVWAWNFGNSQQSNLQNPSADMAPGTYNVSLQASTSFGCQADTSASITVFAPPTIKGPAEITTPVGIPVTLPMTYSANIVSYTWTPASNLDCPTCPNPTATLIFSAEYNVTVTDNNSCTATDSIFVKTICNSQNYFLPNTFSPNGDGVNDHFYPRGTSLYNVQSLTVFNRWGQMVFQRRDFPANAANMGWDGTFGGKPAPADAYVYIVEVVCDNAQVVAIHGSVTLLR